MKKPDSRRVVQAFIAVFLVCGLFLGIFWARMSAEESRRRYLETLLNDARAVADAVDNELAYLLTIDPEQLEYQRLEEHLSRWSQVRSIPRIFTLFEENGEMKLGPEAGTGFHGESVELHELFPISARRHVMHPEGENRPLVTLAPAEIYPGAGREVYIGIETDPEILEQEGRESLLVPLLCTGTFALILLGSAVLIMGRKGKTFRFAEVLCTFLIVSQVSVSFYFYAREQEENSRKDRFEAVSDIQVGFIAEELRDIQRDLDGIGRFYEGSIFVDPWEYQAYVSRLAWNKTVHSWQWIPRLREAQLEERAVLMESFGIEPFTHTIPPGKSPKEEGIFYPVLYVEPLETQKFMIGWEASAHPERYQAMVQAKETGMMYAADLHALPEMRAYQAGTAVMRPVFRGGRYIGVLSAVLSYNRFLDILLPEARQLEYGTAVRLEEAGEGGEVLPLTDPSGSSSEGNELKTAIPLFLFGRTYMISSQAEDRFFAENPLYYSNTVIISGGLLSVLLSFLVLFFVNRRQFLLGIVRRRTRELMSANRRTKEILNGVDVSVFVTTLQDRRILFQNNAGRRLQEQTGMPMQEMFPFSDVEEKEIHLEEIDRIYLYQSKRFNWGMQIAARLETAQDITEQKHSVQALKNIEWMLAPAEEKAEKYRQNRIALSREEVHVRNSTPVILNTVGYEQLERIMSEVIALTETSAAVYEQDGSHAYFLVNSRWCSGLHQDSPLSCGGDVLKDVVSSVIAEGRGKEITCPSGMNFSFVPIFAGSACIGAVHLGFGEPPADDTSPIQGSTQPGTDENGRKAEHRKYETRPGYIIELAKNRLETSAELLGEMVERKRSEENQKQLMQELMEAQKIESVGRLAGGVAP